MIIRFAHLTHELRDDPMENGVAVRKTLLSSAECPEVLCSLGDNMGKELHGEPSQCLVVCRDREVHHWVALLGQLLYTGQQGSLLLGYLTLALLKFLPERLGQL